MIPENSRRHLGWGRLRSYVTLTTLILFSAAAGPVYAQSFFDSLGNYDTRLWLKSGGYANGGDFNVGWRKDSVKFGSPLEPGKMILLLDDTPCPLGCSGKPYASGEIQSLKTYGRGEFATRMKTASGVGLVTGFFTYTGTSFGAPDHDEIDIEILGKDPTQMQMHYYSSGKSGPEVTIPLGFDSSTGYHEYGFIWKADRIEWWVDGNLVNTMYPEDIDLDGVIDPLPSRPGKIIANLWTATPGTPTEAWLGGPLIYPGTPVGAGFDWIGYDDAP